MSQDDEPRSEPAKVPDEPVPPGAFIFAPRTVATWSAMAAVACLATLVLVTAVDGENALSTVALGLAIFAFVAQIIIYIAQANTSQQQLYLSQVVQTETAQMLAGIQARIAAQHDAVERAIPRIASATLEDVASGDAAPPSGEEIARRQEEVEQLSAQIAGIIREEFRNVPPTLASAEGAAVWHPGVRPGRVGRLKYLPDEPPSDPFRVASGLVAKHRRRKEAEARAQALDQVAEDASKVREDTSKIREPPVPPPV